jgi:catechol 2,3-dioxygenase-like lactoylglutathione lyase family enzyme
MGGCGRAEMARTSPRTAFLSWCVAWVLVSSLLVAAASAAQAPPTGHFERVWHFGRVTGDLQPIIAFYRDFLGLSVRGPLPSQLRFSKSTALDEFVATPPGAEFRAIHFLIPGASAITDPAEAISLEAFEYRGIERLALRSSLEQPGASNLCFLVSDLTSAVAAAKQAHIPFISPAGKILSVAAPAGMATLARAVMLRDPDGYPVELMQLETGSSPPAATGSRIAGAMMVVVVSNLEDSLRFYHQFFGSDLQETALGAWQRNDGLEQLRGLAPQEHRSVWLQLPGSTLRLELMQFRDAHAPPFRPRFQDIGHAHLALYTHDVPEALGAVQAAGGRTLSRTGTWTQFAPTLRGFYTRDPDGFFLEVIERR